MIRIATENDVVQVADMMMSMYKELMPDHYSRDGRVYIDAVVKHLVDPKETIFLADNGFFVVRDETEPMAPSVHRYNGIRVYIRPQHRHGSLLARFYKRLYEEYPDGDILGVTEINSEHIKVLDKRHTLIAKVYRLERS